MKFYEIYCAGEFIKTGKELQVLNKYTGQVFAQTWLAEKEQLDWAIQKAERVKKELSGLSAFEKYEILQAIAEALKKNRNYLAEILATESAKPLKYALGEIDRSIQTFVIASEECKRLPGELMQLDWTALGKGKEGIIKYFPAGIVAGISPFNFPMNLAVHKIAPAIAAGCPIILKPASSTPLSTLELAKIIDATKLPKGAVSILPMDRVSGNHLATDERIQVLSFTGSPEVGWKLKEQAGKKKVILELGGNAGVIISEKNTAKELIAKCIVGAFSYSGQICIHAQRFVVHEKLYDDFCEKMKAAAIQITVQDPLLEDTLFSTIIDEANAKRIETWVNEALQGGAELLTGGTRKGLGYSPTILTKVNHHSKVYCEEVFGPVICIEKYSGTIAEAVDRINDSKFGLQAGVFTDSAEELDYCFRHLEVGGVIHNNVPTVRFDQMPYGGVKESGLGREGVKYAILDYMEAKILVR